MQKSYVRIYLKIDLFPCYLFWYINKKLISYFSSSPTWQMVNHLSDHLLKHVRNAAVGGGGYICFGQRPQHSWITGRLFMAQGRHSFLWPKATRFNESQVPPMAGKSGQIKFPLINSSTGAQGGSSVQNMSPHFDSWSLLGTPRRFKITWVLIPDMVKKAVIQDGFQDGRLKNPKSTD